MRVAGKGHWAKGRRIAVLFSMMLWCGCSDGDIDSDAEGDVVDEAADNAAADSTDGSESDITFAPELVDVRETDRAPDVTIDIPAEDATVELVNETPDTTTEPDRVENPHDCEGGVHLRGSLLGTSDEPFPGTPPLPTPHAPGPFGDPNCPDGPDGVSVVQDPFSYLVLVKRLTLLGAPGTDTEDHDFVNVSTIEEAVLIDFLTEGEILLAEATLPEGTYDGLEMEAYTIEMVLSMVAPAIGETEYGYTIRGYFAPVGNIQKQDVTFVWGDQEYWVNRQRDLDDHYSFVPVTEERPWQLMGLWHDPNFWDQDPIVFSTRHSDLVDFHFLMDDGSTNLVIPESSEGACIEFVFDAANTFTYWEYFEEGHPEQADGTYTVGFDCGFRVRPADVFVSFDMSGG